MRKKNIYTYILFLLINALSLYAQEQNNNAIEMFSSIGTMETYIGQHINYKITIKALKNIKYGFNDIKFEYPSDEFSIISFATNITEDADYTKTTYDYKIAFYNHGIYNMPDFTVEYISGNNSTVLSNMPLYVSIKPYSDGEYLPPLQNNQKLTFPWTIIALVVLGIVILIGLVIFILYIIQKKKNIENEVIVYPEDVEALRELLVLENKITSKQISLTQYYFELTQIFRKYLTIRFGLPILEMTTDDIRRHISAKILPKYEIILDFLNYSDFIKFSKSEVDVKNSISNMRFCEMYIREHGSKDDEESISTDDNKQNNNKRKNQHENKRTN